MDDVPACLVRHRVLRHPLFQAWQRTAPPQCAMGAALHQLSVVKAASRDPGRLPAALHEAGFHAAGYAIAHALETERGHEHTCAAMAALVLSRSPQAARPTPGEATSEIQAWLRSMSDDFFGSEPEYNRDLGLLPETLGAIELLEARHQVIATTAARELGVLTAVEVVAARFYMPEERRAVVDSGHYGVTIEHPAMQYFVEHDGLEAEHEREAMVGWREVRSPDSEAQLVAGAIEWCDRFAALLDRLEQMVFRGQS